MRSLIIFSTIVILITSCSDESSLFDPTYFGEGFKGITFTLEGGPEPIKVDPTDWCYFYRENVKPDSIIYPMGYSFGPAYPNPTTLGGSIAIRFSIPETTEVYIYVINYNQKIVAVLVNDVLNAGVYEFMLNTNTIGVTGVYRVIFETPKLFCKGDIWIKGE
ncbi:MAG TPA: hypothetical protein VLH59_15545 [Ignavibacteriaceae bacterium]|nr:hypothetical protein [Ignavibacteriaceae bacterium]